MAFSSQCSNGCGCSRRTNFAANENVPFQSAESGQLRKPFIIKSTAVLIGGASGGVAFG